MDKKELGQITEGIQAAYDQLSETINEIGHLKELTSKLTIATEDMKHLFDDVLNNRKLNEFKENNAQASNSVKANVEKIDRDLSNLLVNRQLFVDYLESSKEMISKFQTKVDEEAKDIADLMKKIGVLTANIKLDQQKTKGELQKASKTLEAAGVTSKYDKLNGKLMDMDERLKKIESLLNQKLR